MSIKNFETLFQEGNEFLNKRNLEEAAEAYYCALKHTDNDNERQQAWQMIGIAYRLANKFVASVVAFKISETLSNNPHTLARIKRDLGLAQLESALAQTPASMPQVYVAKQSFIDSYKTLLRLNDPAEAAVSRGFYGQALLAESSLYRNLLISNMIKSESRKVLREADKVLSNKEIEGYNAQYELNNLIRLGRALSFKGRLGNAKRVKQLAKELNQPSRWKEYILIMIGGDTLYRYLKTRII